MRVPATSWVTARGRIGDDAASVPHTPLAQRAAAQVLNVVLLYRPAPRAAGRCRTAARRCRRRMAVRSIAGVL